MLLDIHVHTSFGSPCSHFTLGELCRAIQEQKLATVVITDHWTTAAGPELSGMLRPWRCDIITGVEITTDYGDFLVFCVDSDALTERMPAGNVVAFAQAIEVGVVSDANAVIWAHPCSAATGLPADRLPEDELAWVMQHVDAVEGMNGHVQKASAAKSVAPRESANWRAVQLAQRFDKPVTYGSDCHEAWTFQTITTLFEDDISSAEELIAAINERRLVDKTDVYFPLKGD